MNVKKKKRKTQIGARHVKDVPTSTKYDLNDINYDGPFTFETVRGIDPIKTAINNMQLVEFFKGNAEPNV